MSRSVDDGRQAASSASHGGLHENEIVLGGATGALMRLLALAGGVFLLLAIVITLVSVIGRYGFGEPVPGDYELVEIICAVGIFLFFPYTHAVSGNITADFFTSGLSLRRQRLLDIVNDIVFALVATLLTWRLSEGLMEKFASGETTILIRIPLWWAYSVAVLSMGLLALVCLMRIIAGIGALRR
jgi:TRAP-type C4-dicarboxylate transport system permease small subunit